MIFCSFKIWSLSDFHNLETFLSRQRKRLQEEGIEQVDWTVFSGIFIAASDEVLPEDALTEALKYIETNRNYKKTYIFILKKYRGWLQRLAQNRLNV